MTVSVHHAGRGIRPERPVEVDHMRLVLMIAGGILLAWLVISVLIPALAAR